MPADAPFPANISDPSRVAPHRAWYAVCIFVLLYTISYVDRLILSLLAPAVSQSLSITDTQIGVLIGLGFGVLYSLTGLPLAHILDQRRRVPLVALGVALWSCSTIASGFAPSFAWLLVFRSGVAVGEAVLSPAAISLIADLFPREKRTLPTTVYTAVGAVMYSGSYIAGGAALQLATITAARFGLEPWQLTLVFVGLPGLLLAPLLLFTITEPARRDDVATDQFATVAQAYAYLCREKKLYGGIFLGVAIIGMINFATTTWTPTLLIRGHGMSAPQAGYAYGTVGLLCGVLGAMCWPAVVSAWTRRGRRDALVTVFALTQTVTWLSFAVVGLARSEIILLVAAGIGTFFSTALGVLVPMLIQLVTPGRMRARVMALYLTAASLVGLAGGPPLAALLSETFFSGRFAIGSGLAVLVLATGPVASIAIWLIHGPYRRALDEAEMRETAR
ncbi:hypothetical protein C1T17_17930 [Sphingobium sp. SCG-1]|uniref:MFS transporter n=1 Tax=Sphingobium sp. SCG-1 TaxID=2072936 RepID=UPI000CD6C38B|nr:MFS transporter [Sphingobium sp. SCG-1]AUW59684.1 hypothetical protein C1T17_17930 [Sphingobium sp. SCG-1]